ncbi:hypothetical protein OE165_27045, partial [Escherichia coli]|uniref:hypothetical protein n=1 Tax=Escherichia coli TaxID=562 RepID=UPI0021F281CA
SVGFAASAVAVEELPLSAAVIMLALKFPLASLATMAETVLADVAVVLALDNVPVTSDARLILEALKTPLESLAGPVPVALFNDFPVVKLNRA